MRIALLWPLVVAGLLAGCGGSVDPTYSARPHRFSTSAPLTHAKRDPDFLAYAVPTTELSNYPATRSAEYAVHGIDVSKYQGDIDWQAVRDAGVAFAYIKASEGSDNIDRKFQANWAGARAVGIPHGAYHFVYWCRSPREEIANFARIAPAEPDALPPVLDVEATPTSRTCRRTLYREEVLGEMREMLEEMERRYGKRPIIYSSVDFYQTILHSGALSEYPIWVRSTKYHPTVRYGARKWTFWQYRSDGSIPGIRGYVDQNAFHGSREQWQRWLYEQTRGAHGSAAPVHSEERPTPAVSAPRESRLDPIESHMGPAEGRPRTIEDLAKESDEPTEETDPQ